MKKLLVLLIIILNNFSFSQKYYPNSGTSGSDLGDVINYDIKNSKIYNGRTELTVFKDFDSISRITLERFIIDRFNYHRKLLGYQPLEYELALRPMCYNQVVYQRLALEQTHLQNTKKIPNWLPREFMDRKLLVTDINIGNAGEGLIHQAFGIPGPYSPYTVETYKSLVDMFFTPGMGYPTSKTHWNDIMDPGYNCIYIYYDFQFLGLDNSTYRYSNVTLVYATKIN
jgi:hypothetical protein